MKILFPLSSVTLLLFALPALAAPPVFHVEIKCEPKRAEVKRNYSQSTEEAEENWVYRVTILSHTFREIPDLKVDYVAFSSHERSGSKAAPKAVRTTGSKALGSLRSSDKTSFETEEVKLNKSRLKADWYYTNGAKGKTRDQLTGIWVRVYSGSELIEEFAQPSSLKTQEKWEG
ncbi:hypothetical protein BH20VER3_BH20VER3_02810 [soil metagenome]